MLSWTSEPIRCEYLAHVERDSYATVEDMHRREMLRRAHALKMRGGVLI